MQKYQFSGHLSPPPKGTEHAMSELCGYVYIASEVDARIRHLEIDIAALINARDVWAAREKAKDARIAELEKALLEVTNVNEYGQCMTIKCDFTRTMRALGLMVTGAT